MKQSELYDKILNAGELATAEEELEADVNPLYSIREAYNDWRSSLPEMQEKVDALVWINQIMDEKYNEALDLANKADYSPQDLYTFLGLDWQKEWEDDIENYDRGPGVIKHGIFPSAFVNALEVDEVRVPDMSDVFDFGYRNSSDIIVEGDVGDSFGKSMEGGRVVIEGDSDLNLAHSMQNGEIIVKGDSEGVWNPQGKVKVHGDLERAYQIEGILRVNGDLEEIRGDDRVNISGQIFVEGEVGEIMNETLEGTEIYQKQNGEWEQVFP